MNKIDFTDIYKFLVSVGTAIIVFAIISPYLLFLNNFTFTLTPQEISKLSPIGQEFLNYQQSYLLWIARYYQYMAAGLFFVGAMVVSGGIWGWYKRQQMRNDKEDAEARTAKREWEKIENKETREQLAQELKVYFSFENAPGKEAVPPVDFEYILAKYTGSRNSLIDLIRFSERYIQNYNYQILVDWKLESFNYDVIIRSVNEKGINERLSGRRIYRVYAIKYAEHNPSTEWLQKVLAELWLSANAYRERNKINEASATLIVLSPSADLENTIKGFHQTIPTYWQHQIRMRIVGVSGRELEDWFAYYQNRDDQDQEYRKDLFKMVFNKIDSEFVKELESEQDRIDKSRSLRETKKDVIRKYAYLIIGWSIIASAFVWAMIVFVKFLARNKESILNFIASLLTPSSLALISIGVILFLAYQIRIRINKVSGGLVFEDGPSYVAEFGLYSGKNFRVISQKELRNYPQLGLKKIVIRNGNGRTRRIYDDERDENYAESRSVIVECTDFDGRKFSVELYPQMPIFYSNDSPLQMRYIPIGNPF